MVTVYSKNNCVQCKMTKRFLDSNKIAYREINLDEQPEFIEQVKELGFSAAPIIETISIILVHHPEETASRAILEAFLL